MHRREVILAGLSLPLVSLLGRSMETFAAVPVPGAQGVGAAAAFDADSVALLAKALSAKPFQPPDTTLPQALANIGYDAYRDYRFKADRALWHGMGLPFEAQFFHRGFLFKQRVDVLNVHDGRATPFPYSPALFTHGKAPAPPARDVGFAGFRLHGALNSAAYLDEICTFLGASYFRAVARGLAYGLSARGLALGTGDPGPEEFPVFRTFWLEQPAPGATSVVVHALLDSPSVAGAFRFAITPGDDTVFDVDARLYPRVALTHAGIAPLTSMFEFDAGDRVGVDDYRPAVHDSDGLSLALGSGEQAWRPLRNPAQLQHSGFQDVHPRGFGLLQRKRHFSDFMDAEAGYQKRPAAWVEPVGDWGMGEVHLVEIPTADEYHDNIVAFWRPKAALPAGQESRWRYRLHWSGDHVGNPALAVVASTRIGAGLKAGTRLVVIEFAGGRLPQSDTGPAPQPRVSASVGTPRNAVAYRNPDSGNWRLSFEFDGGAATVELRALLEDARGALTETWLYRWTP